MSGSAAYQSILGAIEILLGRREGLRRFDMSVDGFWRSFGAIVYCIPFYAIIVAVEHRLRLADAVVDTASDTAFIAARVLDLALDWVAMPLVLAALARRLKIAGTYAGYVIVGNWSSVVVFAPQAFVSLLTGLGIISPEIGAIGSLVILGVMLRYHYVIVGLTLGRSAGFKTAIVVANLALSLVLGSVIDGLFGV